MHTELREVWNAEVGYQNSAREVRGWTWSRLEGARRCVQDLQDFGMHVERVLVWLRATMLGYRPHRGRSLLRFRPPRRGQPVNLRKPWDCLDPRQIFRHFIVGCIDSVVHVSQLPAQFRV